MDWSKLSGAELDAEFNRVMGTTTAPKQPQQAVPTPQEPQAAPAPTPAKPAIDWNSLSGPELDAEFQNVQQGRPAGYRAPPVADTSFTGTLGAMGQALKAGLVGDTAETTRKALEWGAQKTPDISQPPEQRDDLPNMEGRGAIGKFAIDTARMVGGLAPYVASNNPITGVVTGPGSTLAFGSAEAQKKKEEVYRETGDLMAAQKAGLEAFALNTAGMAFLGGIFGRAGKYMKGFGEETAEQAAKALTNPAYAGALSKDLLKTGASAAGVGMGLGVGNNAINEQFGLEHTGYWDAATEGAGPLGVAAALLHAPKLAYQHKRMATNRDMLGKAMETDLKPEEFNNPLFNPDIALDQRLSAAVHVRDMIAERTGDPRAATKWYSEFADVATQDHAQRQNAAMKPKDLLNPETPAAEPAPVQVETTKLTPAQDAQFAQSKAALDSTREGLPADPNREGVVNAMPETPAGKNYDMFDRQMTDVPATPEAPVDPLEAQRQRYQAAQVIHSKAVEAGDKVAEYEAKRIMEAALAEGRKLMPDQKDSSPVSGAQFDMFPTAPAPVPTAEKPRMTLGEAAKAGVIEAPEVTAATKALADAKAANDEIAARRGATYARTKEGKAALAALKDAQAKFDALKPPTGEAPRVAEAPQAEQVKSQEAPAQPAAAVATAEKPTVAKLAELEKQLTDQGLAESGAAAPRKSAAPIPGERKWADGSDITDKDIDTIVNVIRKNGDAGTGPFQPLFDALKRWDSAINRAVRAKSEAKQAEHFPGIAEATLGKEGDARAVVPLLTQMERALGTKAVAEIVARLKKAHEKETAGTVQSEKQPFVRLAAAWKLYKTGELTANEGRGTTTTEQIRNTYANEKLNAEIYKQTGEANTALGSRMADKGSGALKQGEGKEGWTGTGSGVMNFLENSSWQGFQPASKAISHFLYQFFKTTGNAIKTDIRADRAFMVPGKNERVPEGTPGAVEINGLYSPSTNTLVIYGGGHNMRTVLHELLHAAILKAFDKRGYKNPAVQQLAKTLGDFSLRHYGKDSAEYKQFVKDAGLDATTKANLDHVLDTVLGGFRDAGTNNAKAMEALQEFVTHGMTNLDFQMYMKSLGIKEISNKHVLEEPLTYGKGYGEGKSMETGKSPRNALSLWSRFTNALSHILSGKAWKDAPPEMLSQFLSDSAGLFKSSWKTGVETPEGQRAVREIYEKADATRMVNREREQARRDRNKAEKEAEKEQLAETDDTALDKRYKDEFGDDYVGEEYRDIDDMYSTSPAPTAGKPAAAVPAAKLDAYDQYAPRMSPLENAFRTAVPTLWGKNPADRKAMHALEKFGHDVIENLADKQPQVARWISDLVPHALLKGERLSEQLDLRKQRAKGAVTASNGLEFILRTADRLGGIEGRQKVVDAMDYLDHHQETNGNPTKDFGLSKTEQSAIKVAADAMKQELARAAAPLDPSTVARLTPELAAARAAGDTAKAGALQAEIAKASAPSNPYMLERLKGLTYSQMATVLNTTDPVMSHNFGIHEVPNFARSGEKVTINNQAITYGLTGPTGAGTFYRVMKMGPNGEMFADRMVHKDAVQMAQGHLGKGESIETTQPFAMGKGVSNGDIEFHSVADTRNLLKQGRTGEEIGASWLNTVSMLANANATRSFITDMSNMAKAQKAGDPSATGQIHMDMESLFTHLADKQAAAAAAAGKTFDKAAYIKASLATPPFALLSPGQNIGKMGKVAERYRSPGEWVKLPESSLYGGMAGKIVEGPVWAAIHDSIDRSPIVTLEAYNSLTRIMKSMYTVHNPATGVSNFLSNFSLAWMGDMNLDTMAKGISLMTRSMLNRPLSTEEQMIMDHFNSSGATQGNWSTNDLKNLQTLTALEGSATKGKGVLDQMVGWAEHQNSSTKKAMEYARKVYGAGEKYDNFMQKFYTWGDNTFRLGMFMTEMGRLNKEFGDTMPLEQKIEHAGLVSKKNLLDYDIDSRLAKNLKNSALPFVSFTYASSGRFADVAKNAPWKLAEIALAYQLIAAASNAITGDSTEEDKRKRIRDKKEDTTWFGGYSNIRLPSEKGRTNYLEAGRFIATPFASRQQPNGPLGQTWWPQSASPSPLIMGPMAAMYGVNLYTGESLYKPTDDATQKATKSIAAIGASVSPAWVRKVATGAVIPGKPGPLGEAPAGVGTRLAKTFVAPITNVNDREAEYSRGVQLQKAMSDFAKERHSLARQLGTGRTDQDAFRNKMTALNAEQQKRIKELTKGAE